MATFQKRDPTRKDTPIQERARKRAQALVKELTDEAKKERGLGPATRALNSLETRRSEKLRVSTGVPPYLQHKLGPRSKRKD